MKRKFRVLAALVLALLLCVGAACAETTTRCDFDALEMNSEWTEGRMRPYEYHYYPFAVAQTGRVTARVQSFYSGSEFELLDEDLVSWRAVWVNGTAGAPETEDLVYYLEPGQYYLRVDGASDSDGDYRVKVALEPCACDEIEGNDDYHGAQPLPSGATLAGVLTEWDEYDYYTFTLDAETQVYLTANDESDGQCVLTLYDGDMVEQATIYDLHGYAEDRTLSAGTYYLAISNAKGAYTLKAIY